MIALKVHLLFVREENRGKNLNCVVRAFDNCINKQLHEVDSNYHAAKKCQPNCKKKHPVVFFSDIA